MAQAQEKEKPENIRFDPEEYTLRKRLPKRLPKRRNDVYVNMNTNFKAQLERCKKLLDTGEDEIFVHGLGNAVNRAVNLSLQLKCDYPGIMEVSANTSTVELIDDWEPEYDHLEPHTQVRNNSAIHIRVYRLRPLEVS